MSVHSHKTFQSQLVRIAVDEHTLEGELVIPSHAKGLVIFAHGSGSSRHSPRNKFVAEALQEDYLATLLVDLLTEEEDSDYSRRFDIPLLTERLAAVTDWATHNASTEHLLIGYFGASTGAAAAMLAAAGNEDTVRAIVSRGGRVDMAGRAVEMLRTPTLFIVGQEDRGVRALNEDVFLRLNVPKDLVLVPNATHLFEEPGALEQVAELAIEWFKEHLEAHSAG